MIVSLTFRGDPNIGLYGYATDKYCIIGTRTKDYKKLKQALKVPVVVSEFFGTDFAGIFSAGNSNGIITSEHVNEFLSLGNIEILSIDTRFTALGNLVLMNDNGIIISPLLKKHKKEIQNFFGINCDVSKIAGLATSGSVGIATNKGCLLHPKVKENEKAIVENVLGVKADIGTVNFGSFHVRAGIIANSNGLAISKESTGIEAGKINEALGFL
jgi:translation initiation factor 6